MCKCNKHLLQRSCLQEYPAISFQEPQLKITFQLYNEPLIAVLSPISSRQQL